MPSLTDFQQLTKMNPKDTPSPPPKKNKKLKKLKNQKKTQGQPQSMLMFKPIWNFGIIKVSTLLVHM